MPLYNVIVEEAQWNSELIEANSPQEARAKMEARIDAALTPNGDDTEFDDFGDWLYSGDSDTFIHHVYWVENGKECDDRPERIARWWHDARIAITLQRTMGWPPDEVDWAGKLPESVMEIMRQYKAKHPIID